MVHLPRETVRDGVTHREFDVEIAYTSELLRIRGEFRTPKRWAALANTNPAAGRSGGGLRRRGVGAGAEHDALLAAIAEGEEGGDGDGDGEGDSEEEGEVDSDGNPVDDEEEDDGLEWEEGDEFGGGGADDWGDNADIEAEDVFAGGPTIVSDRATRNDIMAMGPVGDHAGAAAGNGVGAASAVGRAAPRSTTSSVGGAGAMPTARPVLVARDGPDTSRVASALTTGTSPGGEGGYTPYVGPDGTVYPPRGVSRAAGARKTADYWRRRASGGKGGTPSPALAGASPAPAAQVVSEGAGRAAGSTAAGTGLGAVAGARPGAAAMNGVAGGQATGRSFFGGGGGGGGGEDVGPYTFVPDADDGDDDGAGGGGVGVGVVTAGARPARAGGSVAFADDLDATTPAATTNTRLGAAFMAEANRNRGLMARTAAAFMPTKPAGAATGTTLAAKMPGAAGSTPTAKAGAASALGAVGGLSSYSYALNKQEGKGLRGARVRESIRKLRFLQYELVADLNPGSVRTFEFWIQFVLLIIAIWLRIYVHFLGQWMFLRSLRVPVYEFAPLVYACTLKYVPDVLPNELEIGVVIMGPLSVIVILCGFMAFSWVCQKVLGYFPEIPSRFIAFFGFAAVLDPALIAAFDAMAGRYDCASRVPACAVNIASTACTCSEGDAWKLYRRFLREEGSGVIGIILTCFMYLVLMLLAAFCLYLFLLHLHLNGRMIDLFRRLHAEDAKFLIPHDFEVSPQDLQHIVSRAQRWQGPRGTTRKVAVCDYVLTDPLHPTFRETTTHLIIYHAALDGKRELYRHFLRMPDGSVLEVFGSMERQLGVASGLGTSALQDLLMTHGKDGEADDGAAINAFFQGL